MFHKTKPKSFEEAMKMTSKIVNKGIDLGIFRRFDNGSYNFSERFGEYMVQQIEAEFEGMEFFNLENITQLVMRYLTPVQLHNITSKEIHAIVKLVRVINALIQDRANDEGEL